MIELRIEPLSYLLMHGLVALAFEAWNETNFGHEHPNDPYAPNWEAYQAMEQRNFLRFVAMREDGRLIGYTSIVTDIDTHNSYLTTATIRDIYVVKDKRGYAARLVRYTESLFPTMGIKRALIGEHISENVNPSPFYKLMGYAPREIIYGKTIH